MNAETAAATDALQAPERLHRALRSATGPAAAPSQALQRQLARHLYAAAAAIAGLTTLLVLLAAPLPPAHAWLLGAMFLGLTLCALAGLAAPPAHTPRGLAALLVLTTLVLGVAAWRTGWGPAAPWLAVFGLGVCTVSAIGSRRSGALLALWCIAVIAGVALAMRLTQTTPLPTAPGANAWLAAHGVLIAAGLAAGLALSSMLQRITRAGEQRERRFRGLLSIAADSYWELDEQWRLVSATDQRHPLRSLGAEDGVGHPPWELPQFACDPDTLDRLRADLESRLPFRDITVQWSDRTGACRTLLLSGEPRFDARGVFSGFWGVARDITRDHEAREALKATETRYLELFTRIPTPLVLHRGGRVIDANPAGVALFGHADLPSLLGRDILGTYESGDSRERARRRVEEMDDKPVGSSLPVADFRLNLRDGRRLMVRASGVRVAAADGPATLSIFVDDTERRSNEEAVRRSEALLSHLVATSPDVITLTELATGRYTMVNRTFERLTGYSADEVVGRTALELGIWSHPEARKDFVAALRETGTVADVPTHFTTKDGRKVSMQVSGARFAMDRLDYLVINARDISESERARLEREAILENASIGIAVTRDQRFVLANPRFEEIFGWPPGGLIGQPGRMVWSRDADYAAIGALHGPALARGETITIESQGSRRDGSEFLAHITGKAIDPRHPAHGGTIWIVDDITERRQFEQALARARDEAEAASRAKSAFLANTSHELRTPLNGILNLAQLARATGIDEPRRQQYLDQIAESSQSLADIISDILDLSKIEAGKLALQTSAFHLGDLLRGVQRSWATLAAGRDLELRLELGEGVDGPVSGDALRVRQILGNYLGNALKFTATGRVRLVARRTAGERVRFEVHDTGEGIDAQTRARLFQPFTQADASTTRRYGGTGLGLSICRELSVLMKGEVGVMSEPGEGSQFWAELPLPAAQPAEAAAAEQAPAEVDLSGARVLMVEDNAVNMMIAVAMLESWGLTVEQTFDGREALEAVARAAREGRRFDAVLMDVQMPVMSGYEATRALRATEAGAGLPVIALTAAALVTEREQALEAGMDDFLTKPIDAGKLRSTLGRWLRAGRG